MSKIALYSFSSSLMHCSRTVQPTPGAFISILVRYVTVTPSIFAAFYTFLKLNDLLGVVLSLGEILRRTLLDSNLTGRSVK